MRELAALIFVLVSVILLPSCENKEIICPGSEPRAVDVRFMWENAPEAQVEGMTVFFFSDKTGRVWRFDISGSEGGRVEVPVGRYSMIAVNNDLPGVTYSGSKGFSDFRVVTRRGSQDGFLRASGMLYAGVVKQLDVTLCGVSYIKDDGSVKDCPVGVVRCFPDSLATVYNVTVRDVSGMESVTEVSGVLRGVAGSVAVVSGVTGTDSYATEFPLDPSGKDSAELHGVVTALGTPSGGGKFYLDVRVTRRDGSRIVKRYDVTDQVANSKSLRNVSILIDGMSVPSVDPPDPGSGDVGLVAGVDDWQVVEIDLQ